MKSDQTHPQQGIVKLATIILLMLTFAPFLVKAQTKGSVKVVKDAAIDTLIARRPMLDKQFGIDDAATGYRVQIYFGSSRQAAYDAQAKLTTITQDYKTYLTYNEPNFRVRAGDFKTRIEAEKLMNYLQTSFTTLFIVAEKINPAKTDQQ